MKTYEQLTAKEKDQLSKGIGPIKVGDITVNLSNGTEVMVKEEFQAKLGNRLLILEKIKLKESPMTIENFKYEIKMALTISNMDEDSELVFAVVNKFMEGTPENIDSDDLNTAFDEVLDELEK